MITRQCYMLDGCKMSECMVYLKAEGHRLHYNAVLKLSIQNLLEARRLQGSVNFLFNEHHIAKNRRM